MTRGKKSPRFRKPHVLIEITAEPTGLGLHFAEPLAGIVGDICENKKDACKRILTIVVDSLDKWLAAHGPLEPPSGIRNGAS